MAGDIEKRGEKRTDYTAPVMIIDSKSGISHKAQLVNYCHQGFYFETDCELNPGVEVDIGIKNSPYVEFSDIFDCYRVKIIRRKEIESLFYQYGYAVQTSSAYQQQLLNDLSPNSENQSV